MKKFNISGGTREMTAATVFSISGLQPTDPADCVFPSNKLDFIKSIRELTGMNLKEAKELSESMLPGQPVQVEANNVNWNDGRGPQAINKLRSIGITVEQVGKDILEHLNEATMLAIKDGQLQLAQAILNVMIDAE